MKKIIESIKFIPSQFRSRGYWVVVGVFVKALLNFIGLAALLAVLLIILSKDHYQQYIWAIALLGVLFLIIKNILVILISRSQSRYLFSLYKFYSSNLLASYYQKGLLFIKELGTNKLTYEVNSVCFGYISGVLSPLLQVIGEALLLILIIIALLIYNPLVVALILGLFIPILLIYLLIVRKKITTYGTEENKAKQRQWRIVNDTFSGYAEIEINQAFDILHKKFEEELSNISDNRVNSRTMNMIPRSLIEIGMAITLFVIILLFNEPTQLKVLLGVFGIAAFRILPGLTSLITGWTTIKNCSFAVDTILEIDKEIDNNYKDEEEIQFSSSIKAENLCFKYPDDKDYVFQNISFEIKRGEIIGIQGISGSGKSTLFNILQGFYSPAEGVVKIDDLPLTSKNRRSWNKILGYVPQEVFIMNGTLAQNIAISSDEKQIDREKVLSILDSVQLRKWYDSLPEGLEHILSPNTISGGEKQRLGIARALYKGAKVVFLDEATSALDNETEKDILKVIENLSENNKDLTLIMIAHRTSSLTISDRIININ